MLSVMSAMFSENLLDWFTIPGNILNSCTFCGGKSAIACSFSGSASILLELAIVTCLRNLTRLCAERCRTHTWANGLDFQASLIIQKHKFASNFVKTLEPASLPRVVPGVVSSTGSG